MTLTRPLCPGRVNAQKSLPCRGASLLASEAPMILNWPKPELISERYVLKMLSVRLSPKRLR